MGCNFVTRLQEETGAHVTEIVNAYAAAREIYQLENVLKEIRLLDSQATSVVQYDMMFQVRRTLRRLSRWLLRNRMGKVSVQTMVEHYQVDVQHIRQQLDHALVESEVEEHNILAQSWIEQGANNQVAHYVARLSSLYSALDISIISHEKQFPVDQVAKLYFNLGDRLSLHWFLKQINQQAVDNHWQALARAAFREDLDWQQRQLTAQVLTCINHVESSNMLKALDCWIENNTKSLQRWDSILNEFKVGTVHEFAKFSVAMRELMLLNLNCQGAE